MKTIIFHHTDPDGWMSAAIALQHYPDAELVPANYDDRWDKKQVAKKRVIVLDLSFPDMEDLKLACNELIWCDHHKTAADTQKRAWRSGKIEGYRNLNYAGCVLTYAYFNKMPMIDGVLEFDSLPKAVQYVGKYDMWDFTKDSDVDKFVATVYVRLGDPRHTDYKALINGDAGVFETYLRDGKVLLEAADQRIRILTSKLVPEIITTPKGETITMMVVNATTDISRLGSYINLELGIDIAAIYQIIGDGVDNKIKVSLRSVTKDVEIIAKSQKGGGHVGAAGYSVKTDSKDMYQTLLSYAYRAYAAPPKAVVSVQEVLDQQV